MSSVKTLNSKAEVLGKGAALFMSINAGERRGGGAGAAARLARRCAHSSEPCSTPITSAAAGRGQAGRRAPITSPWSTAAAEPPPPFDRGVLPGIAWLTAPRLHPYLPQPRGCMT